MWVRAAFTKLTLFGNQEDLQALFFSAQPLVRFRTLTGQRGYAIKKKSFVCLFDCLIPGEGTPAVVLMQYTYGRFSKASLSSFFLFPFAVFLPGQGGCAQRYDAERVSLLHSPGFLLANSWAPLQRPDLTRFLLWGGRRAPGRPPGSSQPSLKVASPLLPPENPVNTAVTAALVRHPSAEHPG